MALQRGGRQTANELANRLDVSMRTIFRDIDALSAMGVPVYSEPGRGGGIRLLEGYTSDLTGLSSGEAEALALIASPASIGSSELATPSRTALDKLAAAVPSMHQLRAQHARGRMLFDTKAWFRASVASPYLDELRACVWNDECVDVVYQRTDGTLAEYEVQPYALVVKVDTWYLVGLRRKTPQSKPEMRVYRLSRLQSLKRTGRAFTRDPDFELQKFWYAWCDRFEKNPPHNFSTEIVLTARGRKHLLTKYGNWFRQRLESLDDKAGKSVTLDFEHEDAALRILFQLGDDAEIVKPKALRRKLHALAQRVLAATG